MTNPRRTGASSATSTQDRTTTFTGNHAAAPEDTDGPSTPAEARRAEGSQAGEQLGLYERHRWLIPATVVAAVFAAFVMMIVITAMAGGDTAFFG